MLPGLNGIPLDEADMRIGKRFWSSENREEWVG
jgi:hypothetical protein